MVQGSRGKVRNPKSYEQRECEDRAVKMYATFGLDPSSRTRVKVPPRNTRHDPAAEFFGANVGVRTARRNAS